MYLYELTGVVVHVFVCESPKINRNDWIDFYLQMDNISG